MRTIICCLAACAAVLLFLTAAPAPAADGFDFGRLHRIDIKAEHPKAYHPAIGDLVQCYIDFPVVPNQIVTGMRVTVEGKSLALVGTINTSRPKIVGSGQVSAFLMPREEGLSKVTIQPVIPGQRPAPVEINFLVQLEQSR